MSEENNNEEEIINNTKVVGTITEKATDETVNEIVGNLMRELIVLDNFSNIVDDFCESMIHALASPMLLGLGLDFDVDEEAKESIRTHIKNYFLKSKDKYLKNRNNDDRLQNSLYPIKNTLTSMIDIALGKISEEVNRGAVLEGIVVNADCKSEKNNKIEVHYPKEGCRIAVPTRGVFISTNCIQLMKEQIEKRVNENSNKK